MLWDAESSVVDDRSLHDGAVFVILAGLLIRIVALLDLRPMSRWRNFHRCSTTRCSSNRCYPMLCPFIASPPPFPTTARVLEIFLAAAASALSLTRLL